MLDIDCVYYHYDFHRGWENESCRLLEASPDSGLPWHRTLCKRCPVPRLLEQTNCQELVLEGKASRQFLSARVQVTFAMCGASLEELPHPAHCPACAQELGPSSNEESGSSTSNDFPN